MIAPQARQIKQAQDLRRAAIAPSSAARHDEDRGAPGPGIDLTAVPARSAATDVLGTPGAPLNDETRTAMEAKFNHDFTDVRVHAGVAADTSARALRARAYSVGNKLVFREGAYRPGTPAGDHLLAHELAHVVQQSRSAASTSVSPVQEMEADAHQAADAWVGEGRVRVAGQSPMRVACEDEDAPATTPDRYTSPYGEPLARELFDRLNAQRTAAGGMTATGFRTQVGAVAAVFDRDGKRIATIEKMNVRGGAHAEELVLQDIRSMMASGASVHYTVLMIDQDPCFGVCTPQLQQWMDFRSAGSLRTVTPMRVSKVDPSKMVSAKTAYKEALLQNDVPFEPKTPPPNNQASLMTRGEATRIRLPLAQDQRPPHLAAPDADSEKPASAAAAGNPPDSARSAKPPAPHVMGAIWTVHTKVLADQQSAAVWRDFNRDRIAEIDAEERQLKPGMTLPPEKAELRARCRAESEAAATRWAAATKDLQVLGSPATTPDKITEIIARRALPMPSSSSAGYKSGGDLLKEQAGSMGKLPSGWGLDATGSLVRTGTSGSSRIDTRPNETPRASTTDHTETWSLWLPGGSRTRSTKKTETQGAAVTSSEDSRTKKVDLGRADAGYTDTRVEKTSATDAAGTTTTGSTTTAKNIDTTGAGWSKTRTDQRGTALQSTTTTAGAKWGEGAATLGFGRDTKDGKANAESVQTQGVNTTSNVSGGLYRDKEKGVGVGADASVGGAYVPAQGISLGPKVGVGGRWFVDVKPVAGTTDRVMLHTTVVLSATVSLTGGLEKDLKSVGPGGMMGDAAKGSATVGLSHGRTEQATYAHELGLEDAKRYLDLLAANGEGGTLPEHQLLATGYKKGWTEARQMYQAMFSPEAMAAASSGLGRDEFRERHSEKSTSGTLGVNATMGDLGVGGSVGGSSKDEVTARTTGIDREFVSVSLTVNHVGSRSVSGTAKMGFAGASVGVDQAKSAGSVYVFRVPTDDTATQAELLKVTTLEELNRLSGKYAKLIATSSVLRGQTDATKIAASLGSANIKIGGSAAYGEQVDYDAKGNQTGATYSGSSTIGGSLGIGDITPGGKPGVDFGGSETEAFTGEVEEHGGGEGGQVAVGKSQQTAKSFSARKTAAAIKKVASTDLLKVFTDGAAGVIQTETTSDKTLYFGPQEYDTIVAEAHDEATWMKHVVAPNKRPAWKTAMWTIRSASKWVENENGRGKWVYNANRVQEALARWTSDTGGGQLDAVETVVRPAGSGAGGVQAALPGDAAALESEFKRLVVRDPVAESKALAEADRMQAAASVVTVHGDAANKAGPENASEAVQFANPGALAKLYGTAAEELKGVLKRLDTLKSQLLKKADAITTAGVHAEMLARLEQRMTSLRHEIRNAQDNAERLGIDAKARAADAAPKTKKSDRLAAEANTAAIAAERRLADTEAQARDKQTADLEARANLDQMWRENAAVGGLFETAKRAHYQSGEDYTGVTRAMDSAAQRLREWKAKRQRNRELVAKFGLGDWLIGPDTTEANDTWDKVYKEVHTWH